MSKTHTERTFNSVNWNLLRVVIQTVVGLAVGILLARMLPPEDFGLLASAMIFIGFAETIGSLGMGSAVIQRPNLTEVQRRIAATLSLIMGLLLTLLVVALAPLLAMAFDNEQVTLVVRIMSISLFISALSAVSRGMLMRRLDFKLLFFIELASYIAGYAGLSLLLVFNGYGVWGLVWGALLSIGLSSVLVIWFEPLKLQWHLPRKDVMSLLHFGGGMSLNSIINYFAANVDYFAIGKFLNQHSLGLYSRAYHLVTLPLTKIATTLTSVMFPAYSEIQANPKRVKEIYYRVIQVVSLIVLPVMMSFSASAEYIIVGLYGENWTEAVSAFRILAVAGIFKVIFHLAGPVVQATGHVYKELRRQAVYFVLLAVGCFSVADRGIEAVACVVVVGSLWLYFSMAQLALGILEGRWREFFLAQLPGVSLGVLVVLANIGVTLCLVSHQLPEAVMLLIVIASSAFAYLLGFLFLPSILVGNGPAWLIDKYVHKAPIPIVLKGWLQARRPYNKS